MNAPAPAVQPVRSYDEELLDLIARQSRSVPAFVFAVLLLIGWLTWSASAVGTALWVGAVFAVLAVRYLVLPRLPDMTGMTLTGRIRLAAFLSGLNGITHALCLLFFAALSDVDRAVQALVLAGLCTGAVGTTAGDRRIFLPYHLSIYVPLVLLWATNGGTSVPTASNLGVAVAVAILGIVLVMLARDTNRQFSETIRIRKEQEEINLQLQRALRDAGVADRAKTRFLASASHDLRQPIHALSLFGAALRMKSLPDDAAQLAHNIDESIAVLASQLDALLDVSKLDAGVITPEFSVIDLTAMLGRIGREYEAEAAEKGLGLRLEIDDTCRVYSDRLLLERIIRNLLNNAVRYTNEGFVGIECRCRDDRCSLAIVDSGIGIPESERDKIFSEFYQVEAKTPQARQGLGLGLSIVARLAVLLGIPVDLVSTPGEGTRFELTLSLVDGPGLPEAPRREQQLEGIRVLIIDDDRSVRLAMEALLKSYGAVPLCAADTDEALALTAEAPPGVILSDLRLAAESGLDAIDRLRQQHGEIPAMLITGDTGAEQIREAHASGFEVLHKPVLPEDLQRALSDAIRTA